HLMLTIRDELFLARQHDFRGAPCFPSYDRGEWFYFCVSFSTKAAPNRWHYNSYPRDWHFKYSSKLVPHSIWRLRTSCHDKAITLKLGNCSMRFHRNMVDTWRRKFVLKNVVRFIKPIEPPSFSQSELITDIAFLTLNDDVGKAWSPNTPIRVKDR